MEAHFIKTQMLRGMFVFSMFRIIADTSSSAWNAVLRGSKYWIMFPKSASPPPGVFVSDDQSEVTSPLSIAEWLLGFHEEARQTTGCIEGVCHEGEVLHVPSGWWHLVVNLSPSIAITQNFLPPAHLVDGLSFLKDKPDQVSGFRDDVKDPFQALVQGLKNQYPDLMASALQKLDDIKISRKRKWEEIVNDEGSAAGTQGFSFGFGGDEDEVP